MAVRCKHGVDASEGVSCTLILEQVLYRVHVVSVISRVIDGCQIILRAWVGRARNYICARAPLHHNNAESEPKRQLFINICSANQTSQSVTVVFTCLRWKRLCGRTMQCKCVNTT